MMFPVCAGQHWSLLVLVVKDLALYAIDSGRLKIFGHSDMQYAPAIGELEKILDLNRKQLTRSPIPTHLGCAIQLNTFDCGYHTVLPIMRPHRPPSEETRNGHEKLHWRRSVCYC